MLEENFVLENLLINNFFIVFKYIFSDDRRTIWILHNMKKSYIDFYLIDFGDFFNNSTIFDFNIFLIIKLISYRI